MLNALKKLASSPKVLVTRASAANQSRKRERGFVPQTTLFATILGMAIVELLSPTTLDGGLFHQLTAWLAELYAPPVAPQLEGLLCSVVALAGMTITISGESDEDQVDMFYPRTSPFEAQLKKLRILARIKELIVPPFLSDDNGNRWGNEQLGLTVLYDHLTQIFLKSQPGIPFFID